MPEIRDRYNELGPDARHLLQNLFRAPGGLQCLAQNYRIKALIWIIRQIRISIALHDGQPTAYAGIHPLLA